MATNINVLTKEFQGQGVNFRINLDTGESEVQIDAVAKFCGWTKIANSGNEVIRWSRVNEYLKELDVPSCGHDSFIPEYIMYALIGKAKNERATKFMLWVGKVLTEIRNDGGYISNAATPEQVENLVNKYASKYCTDRIHDAKSVKEYIRESNKMMLKSIVDEIADVTEPMKAPLLKEKILKSAIKELDKINKNLQYDTLENTYIKNTCVTGARELTDILLNKKTRRINLLESKIS